MVYLGDRYHRPVVNKKSFQKEFPNSYGLKAVKPKLIVKGLNLLDACIDANGTVIPGKTTLMITSEGADDLKFLLSIVNSTLAFFYLKEKYPAFSYNQGTTFTKEMINGLPIPRVSAGDRSKLIKLVDRILAAKRNDPEAEDTDLQDEIDQIIYRLYDLNQTNIGRIEQSTERRAVAISQT